MKLHPPATLNRRHLMLTMGLISLVGIVVVLLASAAGPGASFLLSGAALSGGANRVSNSSAIGGVMVVFGATPTPTPTPAPTPAPTPSPTPSGCAAGVTGLAPACTLAPPAAAASGKHWNVAFSEEFNNGSYDPAKLTPCFDWNYGDCTATFNQGYEYYEPSAISVATNSQGAGLAHLNAAPLSAAQTPIHSCGLTEDSTTTATHRCSNNACFSGTCLYKSGLLSTARKSGNDPATAYLYKFTYGYVEASLKVVNQQGFFVAWWMLPADTTYSYHYDAAGNPSSGPFRYEIDILEMLGHDPTDMEMHYSWADDANAYYSPNDASKNGACPDNVDYSQGLHRFGVDWEPTFVAFYIDGVKCGQHNASSSAPVPNVPMQLILNQMVSVNWQRSVGKPLLNNTLTSDLQADYIRVYQQVP